MALYIKKRLDNTFIHQCFQAKILSKIKISSEITRNAAGAVSKVVDIILKLIDLVTFSNPSCWSTGTLWYASKITPQKYEN